MTTNYTDHLREYARGLALRYLEEHGKQELPAEFANISHDALVTMLTEDTTQVMRLIESPAIHAAIEYTAKLIRYSHKKEVTK